MKQMLSKPLESQGTGRAMTAIPVFPLQQRPWCDGGYSSTNPTHHRGLTPHAQDLQPKSDRHMGLTLPKCLFEQEDMNGKGQRVDRGCAGGMGVMYSGRGQGEGRKMRIKGQQVGMRQAVPHTTAVPSIACTTASM